MSEFATYRAHSRKLLVLGLPLVGSNLAHVLIGVTDVVMLGWYSVEALAAQVIAGAFYFTIFLIGSGFAWAVMPLAAQASETGDVAEVRRITRMGFWASIAFGIVTLPILLSGVPILRFLGQQENLLPLVAQYLSILSWSIFPALMVMVLRSYLSALERTQVVLWITVAAALINAFLNWVLIFGKLGAPELGVAGAAIASTSMSVASFVLLAIYVQVVTPEYRLFARFWRVDGPGLVRVFRHGWPIALTNLSEMILFTASSLLMGLLGTIPLAAHGVAIQLASLAFVVHLGLSNAATVRVGRAIGRADRKGLWQGGVVAIGLSLMMSAVTIVIFVGFPSQLAGLFISPDEIERDAIIETARVLLLLAAAFQTFDGLQVIALGLLRGLPDTAVPMIYAAFAYLVVGVPVSFVLGIMLGLGYVGVWIGLILGLVVASCLLLGRFVVKARV